MIDLIVFVASVSAPKVHVENSLQSSIAMSDCSIVFSEGDVGTGSIGGGLGKSGLENLNLAKILGVNASLSTLVVPQ